MSKADSINELKGNTLRVYLYALQSSNSTVGVRDVQRKLDFSSPSLAVYHLDKLVELGLAEKSLGEYRLIKTVDVAVLRQFSRFGGFIFPRQMFYASLWTTLFVFFLTQFKDFNFYSMFAFVFGFLGAGILWYETIRTWYNRPK